MRADVIAIGDELTSGQRLDTNSQWLAAELGLLGIPVGFHTTAGDTLEEGVEAFRAAAGRSDIVVATGGLGPTADDLTRDVLALLAGVPLDLSAEALAAVEARFSRRGITMPESNRRQALFPRGCRIVPNPHGTAPGIDLDLPVGGRTCRIIALPGVPAEMKQMWQGTVAAALLAASPGAATIVHRRIKCFGAGESAIESMLPDLIRRGRDPLVGITAHEATITLRITARGRDAADCRARIAPTEATIRECLGGHVYGVEDDEVEDAALAAVAAAGGTLATIEVGTEGRVAAKLAAAQSRRTAAATGPAVFTGGTVVPAGLPLAGGPAAADPEAVAALARRVRDAGASIGLAIGGPRTGPEGRTVLDLALADSAGIARVEHVLGGGPDIVLARAAKTAIDMVRRRLETTAT